MRAAFAAFAFVALTAARGGCGAPDDPPPDACPALACGPCAAGTVPASPVAGACPSCSCVPASCDDGSTCGPAEVLCARPLVVVCRYGHPACVDPSNCQPRAPACTTDADCVPGDICTPDPTDPCNGPNLDCRAAGRRVCVPGPHPPPTPSCDDGTSCRPDGVACANGLVGACRGGKRDCVDPATCAPPPPPPPASCDDGTANRCERTTTPCPSPFVSAIHAGCWVCVDPKTCALACTTDADCGAGATCADATYDPCGSSSCDPTKGPCPECPVQLVHECAAAPACNIECVRYDPVCGADGKTYGCGEADAKCHGVVVEYPGACRGSSCACPAVFAPVCGADGRTYGSACEAGCASVAVVHADACGAVCTGDASCGSGQFCYPRGAPAADASGECRPVGYCENVGDCAGLAPSAGCAGAWTCAANHCAYFCE